MDAAGERRARGASGPRLRASPRARGRRERAGDPDPVRGGLPRRRSGTTPSCSRPSRARTLLGMPVLRSVRRPAGRRDDEARTSRDRVGRGRRGRGHRDRPHRAGLRRGGLRALEDREAAGRSCPIDETAHFVKGFGWLEGKEARDVAHEIAEDLTQARPSLPRAAVHALLSGVLALQGGDRLPRRGRVVHLDGRAPPEAQGGRDEGALAASAHRRSDAELARQHGRLEHQPQALLGPAAALLQLRERPLLHHRKREGAARARDPWAGAADGAAPAVAGQRRPRVSDMQGGEPPREGDRRRVARRRHRAVLDAQLARRSRLLAEVVPGGVHHRERRADPPLVLLAALLQRRPYRPRALRDGALERVRVRRERRRVPQDRRQLHRLPPGRGARRLRRDPLVLRAPRSRGESALRLQRAGGREAKAPRPLEHLLVLRDIRESRRLRSERGAGATGRAPLDRSLASVIARAPGARLPRRARQVRRADRGAADGSVLGRPVHVVRPTQPAALLEGRIAARLAGCVPDACTRR